jgi:hypothetical protein
MADDFDTREEQSLHGNLVLYLVGHPLHPAGAKTTGACHHSHHGGPI